MEDVDLGRVKFGFKLGKVVKNDVHQNTYQLCVKVVIYVKTIRLRER